jgi:rifampin ADP-ribosylating transferase
VLLTRLAHAVELASPLDPVAVALVATDDRVIAPATAAAAAAASLHPRRRWLIVTLLPDPGEPAGIVVDEPPDATAERAVAASVELGGIGSRPLRCARPARYGGRVRAVAVADGVRLAVHEQGSGVPVVLLHAWGETHRSFDRLRYLLPAHWHVVVPDQRGVGDSDKPATGYRLEEAASDVAQLLDALGLAAAWVVGTSSGGYVAQQLAATRPDRVRGLVLVGAPRSLAGLDPLGDVLETFHDPVVAADIAALDARLQVPPSIPHDFLEVQDAAALTIPRHVWLAGYRGLVEAEPPTESGTIRVPTLLISGADDALLGPADAVRLAASIPGCRHLVHPGTGHLVLWERPEWVARDVIGFVEEHEGAC